jgi:hypothetical protein
LLIGGNKLRNYQTNIASVFGADVVEGTISIILQERKDQLQNDSFFFFFFY